MTILSRSAPTRTEHELLELFLRNPRRVLGGSGSCRTSGASTSTPAFNTLRGLRRHPRRKTEEGGLPRVIHMVRGVGHVLRATDLVP